MLNAGALAGAGVGLAVVDPFSPSQGGAHPVVVRPFTPRTPVEAFMLWSEAEPLSRLAQAFLAEVRATARGPIVRDSGIVRDPGEEAP